MPLTQSQRNQIAAYKVQIESYRKQLQRLKDDKKNKNVYYAQMIKNTKDIYNKRTYRQAKINAMSSFTNQIEAKKMDIERIKTHIKNIRG